MFACRCSVTTEIMAKCISLHPEYYDFDSQKNGNDKDEIGEGGIVDDASSRDGVEDEADSKVVQGDEVLETKSSSRNSV